MISWFLKARCDRFLVVGAACAALNNIIYIGGDAIGMPYTVLIAITYAISLPLSYFAHALWTFSVPLGPRGFGRYVLSTLSSFLIASAMVAALCGPLHVKMIIAAPLATIFMTIYNFFATRWAVRDSAESAGVQPALSPGKIH
jgi:putative flippase GtrA